MKKLARVELNKLKHRKFSKSKQKEVYKKITNFISWLKGPIYIKRHDSDKHSFTLKSGLGNANRFIYTRGDCGRLAYLLTLVFDEYNPIMYCIHWKGSNDKPQYHFVTRIFNKFYDGYGQLDFIHCTDDLRKMYKHPVTIDKVTDKWLDTDTKWKLEAIYGNFELSRIYTDFIQVHTVPMYHLNMDFSDPNHIKVHGVNMDKLDNIANLFNRVFPNKERSKYKLADVYKKKKEKYTPSLEKWNEEVRTLNCLKWMGEPYTDDYDDRD